MQDAKQRVIEYLRQRQSEPQEPQYQPSRQQPFAPAPRPVNLNLPPWGIPAMAITTIVAGSALMGVNMVLSQNPELEKQRALTESLQKQQETNAVVASEAVRNAGPRFNFCLGLCNKQQQPQQAGTEPAEVARLYDSPTPAPSTPTPTPPAATQVANPPAAPAPAPPAWNQEVYNQWYSYYLAAIPGSWEGYVVRAATVQSSEFDTPEHERAFRDAFKAVEASRAPSPPQPPSDGGYQPTSGESGSFYYADYQNAGQSTAPFTESNPYQDPLMSRTPNGRPCRRAMQPRFF